MSFIEEQANLTWQLLSWEDQMQYMVKGERGVSGGRLYSVNELLQTINVAEIQKLDLYVGLNPTRPCGIKAKKTDVLFPRYILVDIDYLFDTQGGQALDKKNVVTEAYWIKTGRGWHGWIPLLPPLSKLTTEQEIWDYESACRTFVECEYGAYLLNKKWKIDYRCTNIDRVVRCPGSINQRNGLRAEIHHRLLKPKKGLMEVDDLLRSYPPKPKPEVVLPLNADLTNLNAVWPHLKATHRMFLHGKITEERHSAFYATAKTLHELGVSKENAITWLALGALNCGLNDTRYMNRTVDQIFGN